MNFNKFINSDYLKENPLCGIDTYKDELNLANGACIRQIGKLVLTGEEDITLYSFPDVIRFGVHVGNTTNIGGLCTHYEWRVQSGGNTDHFYTNNSGDVFIFSTTISTVEDFKSYLAAQYAAGTPVIVWYVLATPTTETITVPSGLTGTVEGYLNQSGTPTPTNPIYPTANTVEQWFDLNHYIMGTATDTLTTLPANIYPNASTATVGLKGQTVQNGTPSPENPIIPQGTGERTAQLIDYPYFTADGLLSGVTWVTTMHRIKASGITNGGTNFYFFRNKLIKAGTYRITINGTHTGMSLLLRDTTTSTMIANLNSSTDTATFILESDMLTCSLYFNQGSANVSVNIDCTIMFNSGSTAFPYEPYGYKLDISSGDTTTPIYLGEVKTARRIKKLVFDGTENWELASTDSNRTVCRLPSLRDGEYVVGYCTHINWKNTYETQEYNRIVFNNYLGGSLYVSFENGILSGQTVADFKAYLAAQYAAGTPVTVWYVLATPETAVVNEPLMKIGDYADNISGITIPVTAGENTLSVDTTIQPSEVTINYKGWHPVQSVHEKSRNLCDISDFTETITNFNYQNHLLIENSPIGTYTLSYIIHRTISEPFYIMIGIGENNFTQNVATKSNQVDGKVEITFTIEERTNVYVRYERYLTAQTVTAEISNIMLNTGSEALSYEPYWK